MLTVADISKNICTGCFACQNVCPVDAVLLCEDHEGFVYPKVNEETCIECGKCFDGCPESDETARKNLLHTSGDCYAVMSDDGTRKKSSSGGAFSILARYVFSRDGVVYGAAWSDGYSSVEQIRIEKEGELDLLRGSKYIQSLTGYTYRTVLDDLDHGKCVLYTGVPCQIAGLYKYLGKDYSNLITVDLLCHGANSPRAYRKYMELIANERQIERVEFRNKEKSGWKCSVYVKYSDCSEYYGDVDKSKSRFYIAFLRGISTRKNCGLCPYACVTRCGDFTIGDFWNVSRLKAELNDGMGTSMVFANSEKAKTMIPELRVSSKLWEIVNVGESFFAKYNPAMVHPTKSHKGRRIFFDTLSTNGDYSKAFDTALLSIDNYGMGIYGWNNLNWDGMAEYYALGIVLERGGYNPIFIQESAGNKSCANFLDEYFPVSKAREKAELIEANKFCKNFITAEKECFFTKSFVDARKGNILYSQEDFCPAILMTEKKDWEIMNTHAAECIPNVMAVVSSHIKNSMAEVIRLLNIYDGVATDSIQIFLLGLLYQKRRINIVASGKNKVYVKEIISILSIKNVAISDTLLESYNYEDYEDIDYRGYDDAVKSWRKSSLQKLRLEMRNKKCVKRKNAYDVGIVGYWWAENYGSVATYYALYTLIKELGYIPVLIDYSINKKNNHRAFSRSFMEFYCNIADAETVEEYNDLCEIFLVGSDQVWSPGAISAYNYFFYLDFVKGKNKRKLAYASSFGENFETEAVRIDKVQELFREFEAISVREKQAREILNQKFQIHAEWVLDPVFLVERKMWEKVSERSEIDIRNILGSRTEYILSYFLEPTEDKRKILKFVADKRGLPLINIVHAKESNREKNKKILNLPNTIIDVGEEEWLYLLKKSSFVVTDSFHGTCFSMIFNKDFLNCSTKLWGWSRYVSIMSIFDIESRFIERVEDLILCSEILDEKIDYDTIEKRLDEQKAHSKEWLWRNIK